MGVVDISRCQVGAFDIILILTGTVAFSYTVALTLFLLRASPRKIMLRSSR